MANYGVTNYSTEDGQLSVVLASLKTQIEGVVNTKTIRQYNVFYNTKSGKYEGALTYDT